MAREADGITLTEVFESIEGPVHMVMCTSTSGCCSLEDRCTVRNGLVDLEGKFAEFFNSVKLSDV